MKHAIMGIRAETSRQVTMMVLKTRMRKTKLKTKKIKTILKAKGQI